MNHAFLPRCRAGTNQSLQQLHMRFVKSGFAAVQDGNQINHCIMFGQQRCERCRVIGRAFKYINHRQHLQMRSVHAAARQHSSAVIAFG